MLLLATALLLTLTLFTLTVLGPGPPELPVGLLAWAAAAMAAVSLFLFLFELFLCDRRRGVLARIGAAAVVISSVALRATGASVEPDEPYEALVATVELPRTDVDVTEEDAAVVVVVVPAVVLVPAVELAVDGFVTDSLDFAGVLVRAAAFGISEAVDEAAAMSRLEPTSVTSGSFAVLEATAALVVYFAVVVVVDVVVVVVVEGTVEARGELSDSSLRNASGSSFSATSRFRRQLLPNVWACRSLISCRYCGLLRKS